MLRSWACRKPILLQVGVSKLELRFKWTLDFLLVPVAIILKLWGIDPHSQMSLQKWDWSSASVAGLAMDHFQKTNRLDEIWSRFTILHHEFTRFFWKKTAFLPHFMAIRTITILNPPWKKRLLQEWSHHQRSKLKDLWRSTSVPAQVTFHCLEMIET